MTNPLASVLGGDAGAAVLPRLAPAAAPVCGQPWSAFATDAGQIVQAAKRIAALFATDAIVIEIDASDSASSVEAVRRLAAENGRPVVPILPGPVTLAATSDADAAKEVLTGIVEAIGEARPALLRGLHRRFCLYSMASRGTPDAPGLVLGLEPGGACTGVAYRLPAPVALDELHLLWRREMVVGSYRPKWVGVQAGERRLVALTFTVRHDHPQYTGRLARDDAARIIATASAAFGSSLDYLERTRVALVTHGIVDPYLEAIAQRVAALRANVRTTAGA